jgi:2',3'-cyclic-nucleotide 2'-phosphodiesterase (5'-nucleotidase family)
MAPVEDPVVAAQLAELRGPIDEFNSLLVGSSDVFLNGERLDMRNRETNLGDLMCDAVYQYAANRTGMFRDNPANPPACLLNAGVFR